MSKINNPNGAQGVTALQDKLGSIEQSFDTSAAVTAKTLVSIGTDGTVATSATDGTASLVVGVALKTVASGDTVKVVTQGIAENVLVQGAIAAGDILKRSGTTAGYVAATASPAAGEAIGVAMNASASGVCDVWVKPAL